MPRDVGASFDDADMSGSSCGALRPVQPFRHMSEGPRSASAHLGKVLGCVVGTKRRGHVKYDSADFEGTPMSTTDEHQDSIDLVLARCAPHLTPLCDDERAEVAALVAKAGFSARTGKGRSAWRRRAGVLLVGSAVLTAGGVVAAAASPFDWVPWEDQADRTESFATQNGESCAEIWRLVNDEALKASNPEAREQLAALLATFEPSPEAIDAEIEKLRQTTVVIDPSGEQSTAAELFSAEDLERMARRTVIGTAVSDLAAQLGVVDGRADIEAEDDCQK